MAEEKKSKLIEGLKNFKLWVKQEGFRETPVQENFSFKKYLPNGRSTNFAKFEDDDKAEHHSDIPSHG